MLFKGIYSKMLKWNPNENGWRFGGERTIKLCKILDDYALLD